MLGGARLLLLLTLVVGPLAAAGSALAAVPAAGTVSPVTPTATWTGSFITFDFIRATFAAQAAWRKAAAYRDIALGLAPGTSELEKGTKKGGASSCPSSRS